MTFAEAGAQRDAIGAGLVKAGGLSAGDAVGLYSVNCRDWALVDAALHAHALVAVPLYDTLGEDAVRYIAEHAGLAAVACSVETAPVLLATLAAADAPRAVRLVVVFGLPPGSPPPPAPPGWAGTVLTLDGVRALGASSPSPPPPTRPRPADTALLCYTSGTTGVPKGAVLTHGALVANAAGSRAVANLGGPGDVHISYLPLAHIYERVNFLGATYAGVSVGFYSGDVATLLDDVLTLQPTIFASVPRLWNRIYDKVLAGVKESSPLARRLFEAAYAHRKAALEAGRDGGLVGAFWDRLVFSKIRAKVGGRVRLMTTGSAPIAAEVLDFLRVAFGATVLEGYGMTETGCTITLTWPAERSAGHVGGPLPCCEVKLVDIPEMAYLASDTPHPRGEVCVRGPSLFAGYYKDAAQTADVLGPDGWLHTGDVGEWLPGGRLRIIDRKKNIFKLAQGEYIAPEKIEGVYGRCPLVAQTFVYGDSLRAELVAVVVPDPDTVLPWARERGLVPAGAGPDEAVRKVCASPAAAAAVHAAMVAEGRAAKLRGFEQVAAITLTPSPFSVENGLLTPTFKVKRAAAEKAFAGAIGAMYARLKE